MTPKYNTLTLPFGGCENVRKEERLKVWSIRCRLLRLKQTAWLVWEPFFAFLLRLSGLKTFVYFLLISFSFLKNQTERNLRTDSKLLKELHLHRSAEEKNWFWSKPQIVRRIWWKSETKRAFPIPALLYALRSEIFFCAVNLGRSQKGKVSILNVQRLVGVCMCRGKVVIRGTPRFFVFFEISGPVGQTFSNGPRSLCSHCGWKLN